MTKTISKNTTPRVSVLIPVYNGEAYLENTIRSVLKQSFQDFEIVISDNASTDGTAEIAEKFLGDSRIRYFRQKSNVGMPGNFNLCILRATGEYLKFLCADDILKEDALTDMVRILDENPSVTLVSSYREMFGLISNVRESPEAGLIPSVRALELMLEHGNFIGEPTTVMFRREALWVGLIDNDLKQVFDFDLWSRLVRAGDLYIIPQVLSGFRIHSEQATQKNKIDGSNILETIRFLNNLRQTPELRNTKPTELSEGMLRRLYVAFLEIPTSRRRKDTKISVPWLLMNGLGNVAFDYWTRAIKRTIKKILRREKSS